MKLAAVAALYIDPHGVYPRLALECYDAERDARNYAGPYPVVAHPPCGPWGALRFICTKQDPSCGPHAVNVVRRYGGVLEHPEGSKLFEAMHMPWPGDLPDAYGGRTYLVNQLAWGHACSKPTWLYTVGVHPVHVVRGTRTGGEATHRVTSGPRSSKLPSAHPALRSRTTAAFARWLISLALSSKGAV